MANYRKSAIELQRMILYSTPLFYKDVEQRCFFFVSWVDEADAEEKSMNNVG